MVFLDFVWFAGELGGILLFPFWHDDWNSQRGIGCDGLAVVGGGVGWCGWRDGKLVEVSLPLCPPVNIDGKGNSKKWV